MHLLKLICKSFVFFPVISSRMFKKQTTPVIKDDAFANKEIVREFLLQVRSGREPENAGCYLADTILAHQMNAEEQSTVQRTPRKYAEHIRDFLRMYGEFSFEITELLAEGDKVYARWIQTGKHLAEIDGHAPTGKPLIEIAMCVYKVQEEKIVEYWIQIDRLGFETITSTMSIRWAIRFPSQFFNSTHCGA